jgi:hypothetical protein
LKTFAELPSKPDDDFWVLNTVTHTNTCSSASLLMLIFSLLCHAFLVPDIKCYSLFEAILRIIA